MSSFTYLSGTCTGGWVASDKNMNLELGSWSGEDFQATVSQYHGIGAEADLPERDRFLVSVAQLLLRQMANLKESGESDAGDVAIFVLMPSPPPSISNAEWVPMVDDGSTMVTGRLWLTPAAVVSAYFVELPQGGNDEQRKSFVADEHSLGLQPTLIFDPRPGSALLTWFPEGLSRPNRAQEKSLDDEVSPEEVLKTINGMYKQMLRTPGSMPTGGNMWHSAAQHRPKSDAEIIVQSHLKAGLLTRFPQCKVRHEQPQPAGRSDLEIEELDLERRGRVTRHAIIELKVLRSFRSSGNAVPQSEIDDSIRSGVQQAASYCEDKGARWSALCCFDMRADDAGNEACFSHVQDGAEMYEVNLWRWFLYSSSEKFRQSEFDF